MKIALGLLSVVLVLAGCATTAPQAAPGTAAYTGEVWTWDEQTSVVTLRQGGQNVRVKVTPDQLRGLELHSTRTFRGVLAGPAEIATVVTPPVPMMPSGATDEMDVTGTVASIDPAGKATISTDRGPVDVWVSQGTSPIVKVGDRVAVKMKIQPMVPVPAGQAASPALEPAASPSGEPGEYAVVRGRILAVDSTGKLTVESPRGPIVVWTQNTSRYQPGSSAEVRTEVRPAR